ncbi:MAG: hypothetical protein RBT63_10000, partial [Bdellovibrionales bacterium]|nr:hypothetical protein [Bdellovibrionales bacterium]
VAKILRRLWAVRITQDWTTAFVGVLRLPVANIVNFAASYRAVEQALRSYFSGEAPKWSKTTHELPATFGLDPQPESQLEPTPQAHQDRGTVP